MNKAIKYTLFALLILIMINSAFALGVTPSRKNIEIKGDVHETVKFNVLTGEGRDIDVILYPRGALAEFVTLETTALHIPASRSSADVRYTLDIPDSAIKPGVNVIEIVIEETPTDYKEQTVIGGKIAVVHQLLLMSPYLGEHMRTVFTANNPNFGESLKFTYACTNDGTEPINNFEADVEVFDERKISAGKERYPFEKLAVGETRKETKDFTGTLTPGKYTAVTKIYYSGKTLTEETKFVVGSPFIEIEAISSANFKLGMINKLDILVYNKWNEEIKNVFGEVTVKDKYENIFNIFKTASDSVLPFASNTLFGYWDTANINIGLYNLLVKVDYGAGISQKEFDVKVFQNELVASPSQISGQVVAGKTSAKDALTPILILAFIVLIIVNIFLIIYIRRNRKPPEELNTFIIFAATTCMIMITKLFNFVI